MRRSARSEEKPVGLAGRNAGALTRSEGAP